MRVFILAIIVSLGLSMELNAQMRNLTYVWYYAGGRFGAESPVYSLDWFGKSGHKQLPVINYSGAAIFGYCYSYYDEFRIGFEYSDKSFAIDFNYPNVLPDDYPKIADVVEWKLGYVGLPFNYTRNLVHAMWFKWYVSVGFSPEFRTHLKEYTTFMNGFGEPTYNFQTSGDFNKLAFQGSATMGFRFRLGETLAVDLEPWYKVYLRPIHPEMLGKLPYALGVSAGFCFEW